MDVELDITKLKYVLYARKSTTDESRQVRSIDDQIHDCLILATRQNLNVDRDHIIRESRSAKQPNQRPAFRKMLQEIVAGKYDGILAWHPDRLARNMKEGGEIIDMIDEGKIKDLKFVTHYFTNDASGKMLLGMAFVLSKHYSDDLSQKVTRGVRANFAEGKSPVFKHGYIRGDDGYYDPDGKNFDLIKEAWELRKDGTSVKEIADILNKKCYCRLIKRTGKKTFMTMQKLSEIFRDPFYYGIMIQAGKTIDLRTIYDFRPSTTEADYGFVQSLTYRRMKPSKPHKMAFYPLRLMVLCSFCRHSMRVGPTTGHSKRYLYYRCDNGDCVRNDKSKANRPKSEVRAKIIFNFIYDFLEGGLNFTEAEYKKYLDHIVTLTDARLEKLRIELHSKEGSLKNLETEVKERSLGMVKLTPNTTAFKINEQRVADLDGQAEAVKLEIAELKEKLTDPEKDRLSAEQFLNLSKNAAAIVRAGDAVVKDKICRLIFLNFVVDDEKVLSYQLKEPFATLLKDRTFLPGRDLRKS